MSKKKLSKLLALYLPYVVIGLVATNLGEAWRLAAGKELGDKIVSLMDTLPAAFSNPLPSLHPLDLLVGLCCGAAMRLAVYLKGKNAKKYRHGMEYGSARWGTPKDIEPFMAPKFEDNTSPPKFYTEDTLLSAMQAAGADSMPEGVERQGIGTPATRAATIEKLVQKGFLERKGSKKTKVLLPTDKGKALITVMPEEIQSPEMTADWETKLLQIERGEMEPETVMTEIKEMISSLVTTTEARKGANALMKNKIIGVCPNCGANVVEREKGWFCENRECRFVLWKDNAFFKRLGKRLDAHVADKLLRDGRVRLKDCKSAKGKTYNATVLLSCEADGRSKFSLEFEGGY